jgi:hypothetical protein
VEAATPEDTSRIGDFMPERESPQQQRPRYRRGQVNVNALPVNRGPPPRHLLPQRLRPSPGRKLHPLVILPPQIRRGRQDTTYREYPTLRKKTIRNRSDDGKLRYL